jgi:pilus assembly protein CpaB
MRQLRLGIGALCLVAACVIIVIALQDGSKPEAPRNAAAAAPVEDPKFARILVASESIARGRRIEARMISTIRVESQAFAKGFSRPEEVVGTVALHDIAAGQIILRSAVFSGPDARPGLAILVPDGMRAVALRVTDEIAVGNFVRPGDRIDVQIVLASDQLAKLQGLAVTSSVPPASALFLQNLEVLSVGEVLAAGRDDKAQHMQNITVAVTPEQALKIAAVRQVGVFYLSLRHPADDRLLPGIKARVSEATLGLADADPRPASRSAPTGRPVEMILGDQEVVERRP